MSQGRYEFSAVSAGGLVVVAGGKQPRPRGLNPDVIEVFDPATFSWRDATQALAIPRFFGAGAAGMAAAAAGPVMVVAGGNPLVAGEGTNLADAEVFVMKQL
jgi:hypothetical protein